MLKQKILEMSQDELVLRLKKVMRMQTVATAIQAYNCFGTFPNKVVFALAICSLTFMAAHLWSLRVFVLRKQSSSTIVPCIYSSALLVVFLAANLIIILPWSSAVPASISKYFALMKIPALQLIRCIIKPRMLKTTKMMKFAIYR